ncbi:MAG: NADH-quinone oxidoreductase subunit N [Thermoplasmata archaeon]
MFDLGVYNNLWNIYVLFIGAFISLLISFFSENKYVHIAIGAIFSSIALIMTLFSGLYLRTSYITIASDSLIMSGYSSLLFAAILVPAIMSVLAMTRTPETNKPGLLVSIFLISLGFMGLAVSSYNLLFIFLAFEGVSIPTYVITAFGKNDSELEAAVKYFIIGAFSTGLIIFGISAYYISTGSLNLGTSPVFGNMYILAMGLLIFGFGFKLAIFPLHGWAIDTYTGASNAISSLLSTSSKIMTLAVMINIFLSSAYFFGYLKIIFAIIAIFTMTFGNLVAISQKNVKRMLAYSSVAQAGYLSTVFLVAGTGAIKLAMISIFMYALAYGLMKGGSFIGMNSLKNYDIDEFSGQWKKNPVFAVSFSILLLSLAGFPGTLGFIGKYFLFLSVLSTGTSIAYIVVIFAVLNSVLSFYYYGRVIMYMFWKKSDSVPAKNNSILTAAAILTVLFGIIYFLLYYYGSYMMVHLPSLIMGVI